MEISPLYISYLIFLSWFSLVLGIYNYSIVYEQNNELNYLKHLENKYTLDIAFLLFVVVAPILAIALYLEQTIKNLKSAKVESWIIALGISTSVWNFIGFLLEMLGFNVSFLYHLIGWNMFGFFMGLIIFYLIQEKSKGGLFG